VNVGLRIGGLVTQGCECGPFDRLRAGRGALLQEAAGGADVPLALVRVQRDELGVGLRGEVDFHGLVRRRPRHAVEPAVAAVPDFVPRVVAVLGVAPVDRIDGAVGAVLQVDRQVGGVGREEHVVAGVERLVGRALAHVDLVVDLVAVQVVGEEVVAVRVGPVVAEVDHRPHVRVAAVDGGRAGRAGAAFAAVVAG
jgi:hypothetical protein